MALSVRKLKEPLEALRRGRDDGGMNLFAAIGLPILLFVGGIAAWRLARKEGSFDSAGAAGLAGRLAG